MTVSEIREETLDDHQAIYDLTKAAFRQMPYAGGDEQDVINLLRSSGALSLSLVALSDDKLVGHVTFSPAANLNKSESWFALGPVSVLPGMQGQGIGTVLIREGLERIENLGGLGCILTGNPSYYQKFGFALSPENVPIKESKAYFMVKTFGSVQPIGPFEFNKAFYSGS